MATNDESGVELAYIFLEDCGVSLTTSSPTLASHEWFDVNLNSSTTESYDDNDSVVGAADTACPRCEILLHAVTKEEHTEGFELQLCNNSVRFLGLTSDMKPNPASCSAPYCSSRRKRTDAALMLGLALTCQEHHHIVIQKARILFKVDAVEKCRGDSDDDGRGFSSRRAALYLTISVPQFESAGPGERSMVPTGKRRASSSKSMPASTQLLLSLIRSDWRRLDDLVDAATKIVETKNSTNESRPLFPIKLTLEEVYTCVRGLSSEADAKPKDSNIDGSCHLTVLPEELLVSNLAPYLRARCLDSLRNTCWYLHDALAAVVPGLKLRLFKHQINSLTWMRMRECRTVSEKDILANPNLFHLQQTDGDLHRAATGGATVAFASRMCNGSSSASETVRISQETGHEIAADMLTFTRNVARGGLLCDDPGLGKTITVFSLILQTIGLTTNSSHQSSDLNTTSRDQADEVFDAYWRENMTAEFRRPALYKLYWSLLRSNDGARLINDDSILRSCNNPQSAAQCAPISAVLIRDKIGRDEYKESFWLFQEDFKRCFENALSHYAPGDDMFQVTTRLSDRFDRLLEDFKAGQILVARKSFSNRSAKPNSVVAALLDKQARSLYIDSLVPSKSSLLVVPSNLMDHWEHQIRLHVDCSYVSEKKSIVFVFSDKKDVEEQLLDLERVVIDCSAFVFIDKSTRQPLPRPTLLAKFDVVITTTQRFTNEWKNGSFQDELKRQERETGPRNFEYDMSESFQQPELACPLLKVRWLRMVVDEGHSMGRGKTSSAIQFASWVYAERRWAMTGTPTRQTAGDSGIPSVSFLMRYLQHDFFSSRLEGEKVWKSLIAKGWREGCLASFFRLRALLAFLMIRHTKRDIKELPKPAYQETVVPMSNDEIKAYNSLVWGVQTNLVLTSMEAKTSGKQDSLLDPSQLKHAFLATSNIRLACGSYGTKVVATLQERFLEETVEMLEGSQVPDFKVKVVRDHMRRAKNEEYSSCMSCGIQLLALLIFPCGDLVCSECIKSDTKACPVCDKQFDADFFQRLQPGFIIEWESVDGKHTFPPSNLLVDESFSPNAGIVALQPGRPRQRTRRFKDGHTCQYLPNYGDGKCDLCLVEHDTCILLNPRSRCSVCYRVAQDCASDQTKASYIVNKLIDLYQRQQLASTMLQSPNPCFVDDQADSAGRRPLKAIIFSQFRSVLNQVGDRLLKRFGAGCVAEYWGRFRQQEIQKFTTDPNCFCMLLGKDGSEGLDLSFVTNIFFLEQVWDKSLQNQTVARAWRMGAKGRVDVETLISEKTIEEVMRNLELDSESQIDAVETLGEEADSVRNASATGSVVDYKRAKLHFLLKNLRFIRDSAPRNAVEKRKRKRVAWKEKAPKELSVRVRFGDYEANEAFVNEFLALSSEVASS